MSADRCFGNAHRTRTPNVTGASWPPRTDRHYWRAGSLSIGQRRARWRALSSCRWLRHGVKLAHPPSESRPDLLRIKFEFNNGGFEGLHGDVAARDDGLVLGDRVERSKPGAQ